MARVLIFFYISLILVVDLAESIPAVDGTLTNWWPLIDKLPEKLSSVVCWGGTTLLMCGLPAVVGLAYLVREAVPRDRLVSWPCKPWI